MRIYKFVIRAKMSKWQIKDRLGAVIFFKNNKMLNLNGLRLYQFLCWVWLALFGRDIVKTLPFTIHMFFRLPTEVSWYKSWKANYNNISWMKDWGSYCKLNIFFYNLIVLRQFWFTVSFLIFHPDKVTCNIWNPRSSSVIYII